MNTPPAPVRPRIAVIDYGMGNLRSVEKALERIGCDPALGADPDLISSAPAVVLPGVGAFGDAMRELEARGVAEVAKSRALEAAEGGRPFLGICIGMQILVDEGDEDPGVRGLGVVPGRAPRLERPGLKIPHMGWNELVPTAGCIAPLLEGLPQPPYVYFVHGYHVVPDDATVVSSTVDYGGAIAASLRIGNLFATQFHPEKSQAVGLQILANFARLAQTEPR